MSILDRQTARTLTTIVLFGVGLAIIYAAREVIVVFVFAILLAYLINPVVRFLQEHSLFFKNLRGPHILETYLAFLVAIGLLFHSLAPGLLNQTTSLARKMPAIVDSLTTGEFATDLGGKYGWPEGDQHRLKSFLTQHRSSIQGFLGSAERLAPTLLGSLVLIPVLAIFFLSDGAKLAKSLIEILSRNRNRDAIESFADELNTMMQHYIRAKVILGALSFLICSLGMLALGFPHALALGILAGILEFIPILGWMLSATTILSVGPFTHAHWMLMAALPGLWRLSMDYYVAPRVVGRQLEIHPLLAIFTMMVGGAVAGIVGIYLSVPLIGVLHVAWNRLVPSGTDAGLASPAESASSDALKDQSQSPKVPTVAFSAPEVW